MDGIGIGSLIVAALSVPIPLAVSVIGKTELGTGWVGRAGARRDLARKIIETGAAPADAVACALLRRDAAMIVLRHYGFGVEGGELVELTGPAGPFPLRFAITLLIAATEILLFGYRDPGKVALLSALTAVVSTFLASKLYRVLEKHPACKRNPVYARRSERLALLNELSALYSGRAAEVASPVEREHRPTEEGVADESNDEVGPRVEDQESS